MNDLKDIQNVNKCWICGREHEEGLQIRTYEGTSYGVIPLCDVCSDAMSISAVELSIRHEEDYHKE